MFVEERENVSGGMLHVGCLCEHVRTNVKTNIMLPECFLLSITAEIEQSHVIKGVQFAGHHLKLRSNIWWFP